jgi:hypothetical protein
MAMGSIILEALDKRLSKIVGVGVRVGAQPYSCSLRPILRQRGVGLKISN